MNWFVTAWMRYSDYYGRSRRKELWFFLLFNAGAIIILGAVDALFIDVPAISALYAAASCLPGFAVWVRRLHDAGRSGSALFLLLVPVIGWLVLLILTVRAGEKKTNAYGPNPRGRRASAIENSA
ncbi:MAG: DUF805 domain-containing protein [Planctomycetota bacterium]|jgi:uncharacterized membrane protein YhaH (DUF805 family)|nr:DUF805 domain-containing protein [Planctomycetota bacterium]